MWNEEIGEEFRKDLQRCGICGAADKALEHRAKENCYSHVMGVVPRWRRRRHPLVPAGTSTRPPPDVPRSQLNTTRDVCACISDQPPLFVVTSRAGWDLVWDCNFHVFLAIPSRRHHSNSAIHWRFCSFIPALLHSLGLLLFPWLHFPECSLGGSSRIID